jgi:ribosome maturation factor RimP
MEAILDAEDLFGSAYLLEVSSPGLERELYSLKDFEKFAGQSGESQNERAD